MEEGNGFCMEIKTDSRKIEKGDTFAAIKEATHDGHEHIGEAIFNGASKVIAEYGLYSVDTLIVKDTREYLIEEMNRRYKEELADLKLIGVTGTNGKTTSCYLLYQALNKLSHKCAYIGTIGFYKEEGKARTLNNTTPDVVELYDMLLECKKEGYEYVAMEVSSHALDKNRIGHLEFDYVMFTNLTKDHLDYHKTMDSYLEAKLKLFDHVKEGGKRIVNLDDSYAESFLKHGAITYGTKENADYRFEITERDITHSIFTVEKDNIKKEYETALIGTYNIYNLVSIMVVLDDLELLDESIVKGLEEPRGRMEKIAYKDSMIIIDYAHTPDATWNILKTMKELNPDHIYTVIGCGGDRDKFKRPLMADLATEYSDYVIFTSDNPRDEDPDTILKDMIENLKKDNYEVERNRENAIYKGIQKCDKNDILLILGKGHETYQLIKGVKYDFDDRAVVMKYI